MQKVFQPSLQQAEIVESTQSEVTPTEPGYRTLKSAIALTGSTTPAGETVSE